jgi:glutamate synthase (NADPH/NADH) small chain
MQYLIASNYAVRENRRSEIDAKGKHVVIIGGGDTGADCLGTALRQGAADVTQIEIMPKPPEGRSEKTPWPQWPTMLRSGTSHKEGGSRRWSVTTKKFVVTKDKLTGIECAEVDWVDGKPVEKAGTAFTLKADIVLLAMGFVHPKHDNLLESMGIRYDARGNVEVDPNTRQTNISGVFAAGDMQSGASLVVRAINSGRLAAMGADAFLR